MLGAAGGTLFLAILAGGAMVWFRRMRVGANVHGNADDGKVQMAVFALQAGTSYEEGEADASL